MTANAPPDQGDRDRAITELDKNLIVEAGAGSGKTTLLARRITSLLQRNPDVADSVAAVTFTKKAAGELRERVQIALEDAKLDGGLADRVFIGTIHAFCARLLRERPVDAGIDPKFRELDDDEASLLQQTWWNAWIERLHVDGDTELRALLDMLVPVDALEAAFPKFVQYSDVDLSGADVSEPAISTLVAELDVFLARGFALMPSEAPAGDWDPVQKSLHRLWHQKRTLDWSVTGQFLGSIAELSPTAKLTQIRWVKSTASAKDDKRVAKEFAEEFIAWRAGPVEHALLQWREHRYGPIARFLERAAREYREYRRTIGRLSFEDLLEYAQSLLRDNDAARRALGERWRYLLVDEFQDTDPIQAEVMFLLASAPADDPAPRAPWTAVRLRTGALFVVGDPKQSIYRFRRADIEIYEQAKQTIASQGAVLHLTANFRSVKGIEAFVNRHFDNVTVFPETASPMQAAFSPMNVMPPKVGGVQRADSVVRYEISGAKGSANKQAVISQDAQLVASWVAAEIAALRLTASDVMILTQKKEALASHARELAARNVPVAVSGANVALDQELQELQILLELFADPANPVLVASALEGLFVGASPADLWAAREAGLAFTVVGAPSVVPAEPRAARVADGLRQLHAWFVQSHTDAPDVFLSHLLDETGLLAHTAASELGDVRAGLLLRLVDDVRAAALEPELAAAGTLAVLERLLGSDMPDAPLMPARLDAVRVMNLHKAKGLEAPVVILAAPEEATVREPTIAVRREGPTPTGGIVITVDNGWQKEIIAQPPGWDKMRDTERTFADAEGDRRRYVAATRAGAQLVVSEFVKELKDGPKRADDREWSRFSPTLDAMEIEPLALDAVEAEGRPQLQQTAKSIAADIAGVEQRRALAATPGWVRRTVSQSAKADSIDRIELEHVGAEATGGGAAWGRAIHLMLERLGREPGLSVAAIAKGIAVAEGIAEDAPSLVATVDAFTDSDDWRTLTAATERRLEWPVAGWVDADDRSTYLEGVIDAAYRSGDEWVILDWKSDSVTGAAWAEREIAYTRQIEAYAALLRQALGEKVTARIVRVPRVEAKA